MRFKSQRSKKDVPRKDTIPIDSYKEQALGIFTVVTRSVSVKLAVVAFICLLSVPIEKLAGKPKTEGKSLRL